jgi:hypothetical protein
MDAVGVRQREKQAKAPEQRNGGVCWNDPVALSSKWLLRNRIATLPDPGRTNKSRGASLFVEGSPYVGNHRSPLANIGD